MSVLNERFVWSTLTFGWKYSLVFCQRLISSLAEIAISELPVLPFTYLDDVLVIGAQGSQEGCQGAHEQTDKGEICG